MAVIEDTLIVSFSVVCDLSVKINNIELITCLFFLDSVFRGRMGIFYETAFPGL